MTTLKRIGMAMHGAMLSCILSFISPSPASAIDTSSAIAVFREPGFPTADFAAISPEDLSGLFRSAQFATVDQLPTQLQAQTTRLLVLPYGSAFPENAWPSIFRFLERGGNLLVLGGMPFTRAAYRDQSGWHLRDYSVRCTRPLMIDQYHPTPGSDGLQFQPNPEVTVQLPAFGWKRAFSPVIRLSAVDLYKRGGAAGSIDARLDTLAWGIKDGRKLSAPAIEIDHLRHGFDGGRWIFLNAELTEDFYANSAVARDLVDSLVARALQGSEEFTVRPVLPLYLPGEPVQLDIVWHAQESSAPLKVRITSFPESDSSKRWVKEIELTSTPQFEFSIPNAKGLQIIEAELLHGNHRRAFYRSGFWIRDLAYLHSGPRLSVNRDYFEVDGRPLAVIGTTYMSSEVQRLYFEHPNVAVWDRDLAQIHAAGLNMIRTGWWTGWDKFCDENGQPYERTLRTLEAYLMTARKNGLPVQFNFFAFLPDVLGGANPYLDPQAVRRQQTLVSLVVARFHDVPYVAWDLINEPSISQHLWTMRPNGDALEAAKWNEWLSQRYPDRAALAGDWNVAPASLQGDVPLPGWDEFNPRGMYTGHNSLKAYDFYLFGQDIFAGWVKSMRDAIRASGSQQLVTIGQDEGGFADRLSPAYFGPAVDFTTNHTWWQDDHLLWDSLVAKQPGKPMLIQETGLQRGLTLDEIARRSLESEAAVLERKIALSFVQGSGAIEWLWNTNSYMTESNETPIGAVWPDAAEKPEAAILRAYAAFAAALSPQLRDPEPPLVAIITSQAAQFSVMQDAQLEAQRKSVRALAYHARLTPHVIAENQIDKMGSPRLAILPSPQALTEAAWQRLLAYVNQGGSLLVTGPVDRNEHWQRISRAAKFIPGAQVEPLTYHNARLELNGRSVPVAFDQQAQSSLESLRFRDGASLREIAQGKGRIYWTSAPVELAESAQPASELYAYVAERIGLAPAFDALAPIAPGVLVSPVILADSVLYVLSSDDAGAARLDLRDKVTGVRFSLNLPSEHAALVLIGKREKRVIAKYGY